MRKQSFSLAVLQSCSPPRKGKHSAFRIPHSGIASLNLLLDFDNFDKGQQYGAPAYMEWFCAMGLLVTLMWLYIEILRLVAIISGRD